MKPVFRALASLKLTVVLLLLIAVALSAGTILESLRGAEAARSVYYAPWFLLLEVALAVNIGAALWDRWPRDRWRIGFVITHASVLVILAGALVTATSEIQGQMPLWEGQSSDRILRDGEGPYRLPFRLRLDDFQIDFYPGTRRPSMFRSRVTVVSPSGAERPGVIEMNRPLSHGGYRFFQSSYRMQHGREMSILSVSKDPGQPIVFLGYALLVLGMLVVLGTRVAQRRVAARGSARGPGGLNLTGRAGGGTVRAAWVLAGLLGAAAAPGAAAGPAGAAGLPPARLLETLRRLPVQNDGRTMPLDTQARDDVRTVTGRSSWRGIDPVALVVGWTIDPRDWMDEPVVRIDDDRIARLVGLPPGTRYASYGTLLGSNGLRQALGIAHRRETLGRKPPPLDKHLFRLEERLGTLDAYLGGDAIRAVPAADPRDAWRAPEDPRSVETYAGLAGRLRSAATPGYPGAAAIEREVRYNAARPGRIAWWLLVPAAIAAGLSLSRRRAWLFRIARVGTLAGFAAMTWGLVARWQIAGRIPASNMYESMLFLGWGVGLFAVVAVFLRNRMLLFNGSAMSAVVMLLLDRLPIDPYIHPMAPVLSGTPWLAIHVPIIMVSYSVFAIATFLAHVVLGVWIFAPARRDLAERWSDYLYWYLIAGSILLIAGILTGSVWAASSWGRYWGWDPKEVWSLVAFLAYMAILHARSDGQIGSFGVAVASIAAFWTILMTYLGVNFVLAAGLHSYGFGSGNLVLIMGVIALAETAFVLAGAWARGRPPAPAPPRTA